MIFWLPRVIDDAQPTIDIKGLARARELRSGGSSGSRKTTFSALLTKNTFAIGLFVVFCGVCIYFAARMASAQQNVSPAFLEMSDALDVLPGRFNDRARFGFFEGDRIVEVNGIAIRSLAEYQRVVRDNSSDRARLIAKSADGGVHRVDWAEIELYPRFPITGDGVGMIVGLPEPMLPLRADELGKLTHVDGLPIGTRVTEADWARAQGEIEWNLELNPESIAKLLRRPTMRATISGEDGPYDVVFFLIDWRDHWARFLGGVLIGLIGIGVWRLRPETRSSLGFVVFCLAIAALSFARALPFGDRGVIEQQLYLWTLAYAPAVTSYFLATFTPLRQSTHAGRRLVAVVVIFGTVILAINAIAYPNFAAVGTFGGRLLRWAVLGTAVLMLGSMTLDYWIGLLKIAVPSTDRLRMRVLRYATVVAFVPSIIYLFVRADTGRWAEYGPFISVSFALFPLIIGYSIVRHNFLMLNEFLYESLGFGALVGGLIAVYALTIALVTPWIVSQIPATESWLSNVVALGLGLSAIPLNTQLRKALRSRFTWAGGDYEELLSDLQRSNPDDTTTEQFGIHLEEQLRRASGTDAVMVTLYLPGNLEIRRSFDNEPVSDNAARENSIRAIIDALASTNTDIHRDELVEAPRMTPGIRAVAEAMTAMKCAIALPMSVGGRTFGAILVGEKVNGQNYRVAERTALRRIAQQATIVFASLLSRSSSGHTRQLSDLFPDIPKTIGPYSIIKAIGEGGMSYVYEAERDGKRYAVKVANNRVLNDPMLLKRFRREAEAMKRLKHPNIVPILDMDWEGREPYLVTELYENGSLDDYLKKKGTLPEAEALDYIRQAAEALEYALSLGIIHRDVKPRNMFLANDGTLKLGDFGIAKILDQSTITQNEIVGTPQFIAPEVILGEKPDWRVDLYALGITLYVLLTGTYPYTGETAEAVLYQHVHEPVPTLAKLEGLQASREIFQKCVSKSKNDRFSRYRMLIEDARVPE